MLYSAVTNKTELPESCKTKTKLPKKKAASDDSPGKVVLSDFPSSVQMLAKQVQPHYKVLLAISFETSLQNNKFSYMWDLIKKLVKDSPPVHAFNNKKAFKILKKDTDMQKQFIDFVSTYIISVMG